MQDFRGFYFRTRVILIDDNESFLDNLGFKLSDDFFITTFSNPYEALEEITSQNNTNILSNVSDLLVEVRDEDDDASGYSVDFVQIKELAKNPIKNNIISVVIIDYSMPQINGIDFCEKISQFPILKIMLTGHADFKIAVDAFNRGIIDRFLVKDSPLMLDEINQSINIMQARFFEKKSYPLITCFSKAKDTLVNSIQYTEHLKSVIEQINAVEFYILNAIGSYLFITENGLRYYFIVLLDKQLDEYIDIAENANSSKKLINQMIERTHAPIFIEDINFKIPVSDWDYLLQPIQKINDYYYCIFSEEDKL